MNISSLIHRHEISILGCFIYSLFVNKLLSDFNKKECYKFIKDYEYSKYFSDDSIVIYSRLLKNNISVLDIDNISLLGYVVDTLEAII